MKIRTDFVTNSSSSGFVALIVNTKSKSIEARMDYDTGYGYLWDQNISKSSLDKALDSCVNGRDLIDIFNEHLSCYFEDWLKGDSPAELNEILSITDFKNVLSLEVHEEMYPDGDEEEYWDYSKKFDK